MGKLRVKRIMADLLLLVSILFLPWWVSVMLSVVLLFMFDLYYEAIVAGFLTDSLYGQQRAALYGIEFVATLAAGAAFIAVLYLKTKLRYYT